jgi:hypothetical protein
MAFNRGKNPGKFHLRKDTGRAVIFRDAITMEAFQEIPTSSIVTVSLDVLYANIDLGSRW